MDITKLDKLLNLVGETAINQARLEQIRNNMDWAIDNGTFLLEEGDQNQTKIREAWERNVTLLSETQESLLQIMAHSDRIIRELQDQVMNVRMVPIGTLFNAFQRLVRDAARNTGKQIRLDIQGEGTELDKTIVEQLSNPFKHLIRNSIDHGIEMPDIRQARGKSPQGTITLNAFHKEGSIQIEIKDDGGGIDANKILAIARKKGVVAADEELTDDESVRLIFRAGFSTAKAVSDLSGRGVGMDVVRRDIEALRGQIDIQTQVGEGSVFRIKLPLTMAIIDGMLVGVGDNVFIVPLLSIVESLRPRRRHIKSVQNQGELIEVRGEYIPLVRLYQLFHMQPKTTDPSKALVVIVENGGRKACLLVDEAIDQRQSVIKSLEDNFWQVPGVSGATILSDGRVSLILDVPGVLKQAAA